MGAVQLGQTSRAILKGVVTQLDGSKKQVLYCRTKIGRAVEEYCPSNESRIESGRVCTGQ